jgi:hypothetical protein
MHVDSAHVGDPFDKPVCPFADRLGAKELSPLAEFEREFRTQAMLGFGRRGSLARAFARDFRFGHERFEHAALLVERDRIARIGSISISKVCAAF